jgi:hypothetical protein
MAGPRPGEPGVPWWERWRAFADFTGVATAAAWDLAPEPVLARGAPDTVDRAMADTLTAYQHASALDVIGMRGEGKLLLATTADPIGRVAERSGFSSQSYFDRLFRAHHGQTPRAYREQARRAAVPREP